MTAWIHCLLDADAWRTWSGPDAELQAIRVALDRLRARRGVKALVLDMGDGYTATICRRESDLSGMVEM